MTDKGFSLHSFEYLLILLLLLLFYSSFHIHIDFIDVWLKIASAASSESIDIRMKLIFIACSYSLLLENEFIFTFYSYFTYLSLFESINYPHLY